MLNGEGSCRSGAPCRRALPSCRLGTAHAAAPPGPPLLSFAAPAGRHVRRYCRHCFENARGKRISAAVPCPGSRDPDSRVPRVVIAVLTAISAVHCNYPFPDYVLWLSPAGNERSDEFTDAVCQTVNTLTIVRLTSILVPRMKILEGFPQKALVEVRVDLGRGNAFVPEHFLYSPKVRAALHQVCGK